MIKFENVNYKYKNSDFIFEGLDFEINEGEFICVVGKNGNGKSTLLSLMSGITKPTSGDVLIDNINTKSKKEFINLRTKIGIVFQNPENQILFPSVYEDLEFALKNLGLQNRKQRIEEALEDVNMREYINKDLYELSLGQKQRINIAGVLAIKPKYIILDEPTTMIDPNEKENIYRCLQKLKKEGYTIIFATNNVDEILLSDKIFIVDEKQIKHVFDKKNIMQNIDLLEKCDIKIPDILQIVLKLSQKNIDLNIKDWTISEIIDEIVKVCKNEKYT